MSMFKQMAAAAALLMACGGVLAQDATGSKGTEAKQEATEALELPKLMVGDKAPALTVSKWVKGAPVTGFEKGKTYIVEFWATWCGPCRTSIPHLTEVQKKHKDVTVIGVSVWESDTSAVEPFVAEMGEQMEYAVAMDELPAPKDDSRAAKRAASSNGKMAKAWMEASASGGIPTAFIVNGEGRIAWIGHPMEMDEPLEKILAGKQDLKADAAAYRADKEAEARTQGPMKKFQKAMQDGDHKKAIEALGAVEKANPKMASQIAMTKYNILMTMAKDFDAAYALGHEIVDGVGKDNAMLLNSIAWPIVDPDNIPEKQDLKLAEKAALRACELAKGKPEEGMLVDTLAAVFFAKKEYTKAVELQEKAVKLTDDEMMKEEMQTRLEQFKKAAAGGGS
jgi:thiol-disulfide isomerase/thioredoxin